MAADSRDVNLEMAEGQAAKGQAAEGQAAEGQTAEGRAAEGQAAEGQTAEGRAAEGRAAEGQAAEGRAAEGQAAEGQKGAGDAHGEAPPTPIAVPTVSEKVPEERVDGKKARVPRRILHFSDGTLEEYSTDEDEPDQAPPDALTHLRAENPTAMGWVPWAWWWFRYAGYRSVGGVDDLGEKLAYMLGITSPKYQYELDEYHEMKKKEEEEKAQRDVEEAGWTPGTALTTDTASSGSGGSSNPAAYLVTSDPAEPVTTPPAGGLPDQAAAGVSGQPVAANATAYWPN